jgi:RNA polymerase sigma factor (sigma-70 family)
MEVSDGEAFERLLAWLHPEREQAARLYRDLRRRMIRLFEYRHGPFPEDLADETLLRLARRVAVETDIKDPYKYCIGVAHNVYREVLRERAQRERALSPVNWPPPPPEPEEEDPRLERLRHCLDQLRPPDHRLIVDFYNGDDRIRSRQGLAERHRISANALRIRVYRIRRQVEDCMGRRRGKQSA